MRDRLIDDAFEPEKLLNKPFLRNTAGSIVALPRPQTGGVLKDGFGYGPDDDLPGLVVMANLGAARVFDENFNRTQDRVIRNMGGFINSVSQELLTKGGGSAIVAWMHAFQIGGRPDSILPGEVRVIRIVTRQLLATDLGGNGELQQHRGA